MATPEGLATGDDELIFVAHNHHDRRCGQPPRLRNTDNPRLYYGYIENRYCEQFVLTFDQATKTGMVSGGDLGWDDPKTFTLEHLDEALRGTRKIAEQVVGEGGDETSDFPVIDAALELGRLSGLTGKYEVIWLRACLEACSLASQRSTTPRTGNEPSRVIFRRPVRLIHDRLAPSSGWS